MTKQTATKSRFTNLCPRRLSNLPTAPCPSALLRLEFIQDGRREVPELPGCPYYINDALSHYCWFSYCDKDIFSPHSTKEIARVLSLTPAQVEKAEKSGLEKLAQLKNTDEIKEIQECLADLNQGNIDDTIYAIGSFTAEDIDELERTFYCGDVAADEEIGAEKANEGRKKRGRRRKNPEKGHPVQEA
jgi:hypothetical protein